MIFDKKKKNTLLAVRKAHIIQRNQHSEGEALRKVPDNSATFRQQKPFGHQITLAGAMNYNTILLAKSLEIRISMNILNSPLHHSIAVKVYKLTATCKIV